MTKQILEFDTSDVRCQATVDLISKVHRPWLFMVTVTGMPPHAYTRRYEMAGISDTQVAMEAIKRFTREMQQPVKLVESTPWY